MERKWLFFDIDGTLVPFGEDARPSPRTLEALSALRAQGHKVFLCTGRTKCDIGKTLLCFDVDGVISGAGARIEMDGVCVREKLLPLRLLRRSAAQILQLHVSCILEGTHGFYYVGQGSVELPWNFPRVMRAGEITHEMCVEKFTAHTGSEAEFAPLAACLAPVYDIYARPDGRFFEMVRKGQDKASAIRWLCEKYGVAKENTYAFGDSQNDLPMFRTVGTGVAMGSAPHAVCREAALVTGTLEEEGVAGALQRLGLI